MSKIIKGTVTSTKRGSVVTVEVTRKVQHPKYKKLMTRSKKFSVALNGHSVNTGDTVMIAETRPISKTVHFVIKKTDKGKEKSGK